MGLLPQLEIIAPFASNLHTLGLALSYYTPLLCTKHLRNIMHTVAYVLVSCFVSWL